MVTHVHSIVYSCVENCMSPDMLWLPLFWMCSVALEVKFAGGVEIIGIVSYRIDNYPVWTLNK